MGPLTVLTAIVLGSVVAITFGLTSVLVVFLIIGSESGEVATEIARLPFYCVMFVALSGVAGTAMYSLLKSRPWRWRAQWAMWGSVVLAGLVVWWRN